MSERTPPSRRGKSTRPQDEIDPIDDPIDEDDYVIGEEDEEEEDEPKKRISKGTIVRLSIFGLLVIAIILGIATCNSSQPAIPADDPSSPEAVQEKMSPEQAEAEDPYLDKEQKKPTSVPTQPEVQKEQNFVTCAYVFDNTGQVQELGEQVMFELKGSSAIKFVGGYELDVPSVEIYRTRDEKIIGVKEGIYTYVVDKAALKAFPNANLEKTSPVQQPSSSQYKVITYRIRPGDTVEGILDRFKMTRRELHDLNKSKNLLSGSYIIAGDPLKVYDR
jgi:hypothetical protein